MLTDRPGRTGKLDIPTSPDVMHSSGYREHPVNLEPMNALHRFCRIGFPYIHDDANARGRLSETLYRFNCLHNTPNHEFRRLDESLDGNTPSSEAHLPIQFKTTKRQTSARIRQTQKFSNDNYARVNARVSVSGQLTSRDLIVRRCPIFRSGRVRQRSVRISHSRRRRACVR